MIIITNCFFDSLIGGLKSAVGSIGKAVLSPISYGINSMFGQSEMQKYERQLSRNEAYQKEMIDYQNQANLKYNKDLTLFNNEQTKDMSQYMFDNFQSPKAQSLAYKQAGLNPYMLTNAGNFSPTASSAVSGGSSAPSSGATYTRDAPISVLDAMQYRNLESQAQYNEAQTNYINELKNGVMLDNAKKNAEKPYWEQNAREMALGLILGNSLTSEDITAIQSQVKVNESIISLNTVLGAKHSTEIGNLLVQRSFLAASIEEKMKMLEKIDSDISVGKATAAMLYANADYMKELKKLPEEQRNQIIQTVKNLKTQDDINQVEHKIKEIVKDMKETDKQWQPVEKIKDNILTPIVDMANATANVMSLF